MESKPTFLEASRKRILVFDGAMGTEIQKLDPTPKDFPNNKDGFNDGLVLTHPEWIVKIHEKYIRAGADCIETNTFGSNKIKLDEYGFGDRTVEINEKAVLLALDAIKNVQKHCYVIGSMGPSGYLPSSDDPDLGQMPIDNIRKSYEIQAKGLISGGVDALLIETSQDILEVKLAVQGSHIAMQKADKKIPIISNITLDQYGKMLLGTKIDAAYTTISPMGIDVFGLNCSTGPEEMEESIRWLNNASVHPIIIVPNAGMPINEGGMAKYEMSPKDMSTSLGRFIKEYPSIRMIGGCCGTTPEHIDALRTIVDSHETNVENDKIV
ncbi:MAG: homocysteine S-methyltransferase [Cenarchaeum symbiont of Oopsacas minuta]|nr:homocysteine S-methyltransferase [Cenarchaeum symbiont of Oopsacas minuta]